jgi:hypothetical protein
MRHNRNDIEANSLSSQELIIHKECQKHNNKWHHYQTKQKQADAYRVFQSLSESTGECDRLEDDDGRLVDLLDTWKTFQELTNLRGIIPGH